MRDWPGICKFAHSISWHFMINPFHPGDQKEYLTQVTDDKLARFDSGLVHALYSTFALGKDAEWACRLFVLEMKEPGEEGIGSYLSIEHLSPAPLGAEVRIVATLETVKGNEIDCSYEAFCGARRIAKGRQIQRIINKEKFDKLVESL